MWVSFILVFLALDKSLGGAPALDSRTAALDHRTAAAQGLGSRRIQTRVARDGARGHCHFATGAQVRMTRPVWRVALPAVVAVRPTVRPTFLAFFFCFR